MAKTKLQLFEDKLIQEGVTDEALLEFETLLKRSGDDWNSSILSGSWFHL